MPWAVHREGYYEGVDCPNVFLNDPTHSEVAKFDRRGSGSYRDVTKSLAPQIKNNERMG